MYSICWAVTYLVGRVILLHWSAFLAGLGNYQAQSSLLHIDVFTFKISVPELQILPFAFAFATPNKKSKCRSDFPLATTLNRPLPPRPIVYTVKTCHCTSFRQGESQTGNNQTTIQTDAPSNHQGPISGDIW